MQSGPFPCPDIGQIRARIKAWTEEPRGRSYDEDPSALLWWSVSG
jgi:hypothetical protein